MKLVFNGQEVPMTRDAPERPGIYVVHRVGTNATTLLEVGDKAFRWAVRHDVIRSVEPMTIEFVA